MKYAQILAATTPLLLLVGCATAPEIALLQPVGPAPTAASTGLTTGSLQVYSARELAGVDPNTAEFLWNNDDGKNEFLFEPAHTDYTLYSASGKVLEIIRNARDPSDPVPAQVALAPGLYKIKAQVETGGGDTSDVTIPVVVESGKRTAVHLEGDWRPSHQFSDPEVVRLPDGHIAGWCAVNTK